MTTKRNQTTTRDTHLKNVQRQTNQLQRHTNYPKKTIKMTT